MDVKIVKRQLPITSLSFLTPNFLLAGLGSSLLLYSLTQTCQPKPNSKDLVYEWKIFDHARIHRITSLPLAHDDGPYSLILCAGKETAVVQLNIQMKSDFTIKAHLSSINIYCWPQWILDSCKIGQFTLAFITAYNTIFLAEINSDGEILTKSTIEPDERPLLWSAAFSESYYTSFDQITVVSGTVMLEILVWSPGLGTQISYRFTGHKGTIFSVAFSPSKKQLASVSDDRTLRIWNLEVCNDTETGKNCKILWGHQGRIWRCEWVDENSILTAGEDTRAFYWSASENFEPRQLGVEHDGHGLWSIAFEKESHQVVSGGADGCIQLTSLRPPEFNSVSSLKAFDILDSGKIVISDKTANISILDPVTNQLQKIYHDDRFYKSVCHIKAIPESQSFVIVNVHGFGAIITLNDSSIISKSQFVEFNLAVFSVHIMRCKDFNLLLIYDRKMNCINAFRMNLQDNEVDFQSKKVFQLEVDWGHVLCSCASVDGEHIFVGTRNGFIIALEDPKHCSGDSSIIHLKAYAMVHDQGVRDIRIRNEVNDMKEYEIETIGRDGYLIRSCLINNEFVTRHAQHFSRGWLEKFVDMNGIQFLAYFNSAKLFLANKLGEIIAQFYCPSVPPNWALLPSKDSISLYTLTSHNVKVHKIPINFHTSIRERGHGREVRDTDIYSLDDGRWLLASGSEDAILRISLVDRNGKLSTLYRSTTMDAAIKSISWFKDDESPLYLFVSAACMKLSCLQVSIRSNDKKDDEVELDVSVLCEAPIIDDPETRIMGCQVVKRHENVLLVAGACSNGNLWTWKLRNNFRQFSDANNLAALQNLKRCMLSLKAVQIDGHVLFLAGSTNGRVTVWDSHSSSGSPILEFKAHQSGVNKIAVCRTSSDTVLVATGGEDNAISLTVLRVRCPENGENIHVQVQNLCTVPNAHYCAIQGLEFTGRDTIVSFSLDQRIKFWSTSVHQEGLTLDEKMTIVSELADGSSLCFRRSRSGEDAIIVTAGIGIEIWKYKC